MKDRTARAFEKGQSACRRGKLMRDNPYTHETSVQSANFWAWQKGYCAQAKAEADEASENYHAC